MSTKSNPYKRLFPFKGRIHAYSAHLETEVTRLQRKVTELEARLQAAPEYAPRRESESLQLSHKPLVKGSFGLDSLNHSTAPTDDSRPLKRRRTHTPDGLLTTQPLSDELFSQIIAKRPAFPVRAPEAVVFDIWNNSIINQVQTSLQETLERPAKKGKMTKPEFLAQMPNSQEQWLGLRNASRFDTPRSLLDCLEALTVHNYIGVGQKLLFCDQQVKPRTSSELLEAYQGLKQGIAESPQFRFRELLLYCIGAVSIEEGLEVNKVNELLAAYTSKSSPEYLSRLRTSAKHMARAIEQLEHDVGYRGSQLFLMSDLPMATIRSITESKPTMDDFTKQIAVKLKSTGVESTDYHFSFSPVFLMASLGVKLQSINKTFGTSLTSYEMSSRRRDCQTSLELCGHSTGRPTNKAVSQTTVRDMSEEIKRLLLPSVSNILQTAQIQPKENEISTIDIGDEDVSLRSLLHTKERRHLAEMAIEKNRLIVRNWAHRNGFDNPWYSAQSIRLKAGSLWTPPSMVVLYIALSTSSNVIFHKGKEAPRMKDGSIDKKCVKPLSWYPKALHTFNSSHSITTLAGDIDLIFIKVINGPSKTATT